MAAVVVAVVVIGFLSSRGFVVVDVLPLEGAVILYEEDEDAAAAADVDANAAQEHRRQQVNTAANVPARAVQLQATRAEMALQNAEYAFLRQCMVLDVIHVRLNPVCGSGLRAFRYEAAVAADLSRQAAATPSSTSPGESTDPAPSAPQKEEEDEVQRAIAMSLAETNDPPPTAVAHATATAQNTAVTGPESTTPVEDSGPAATGTAAAVQDWTTLTTEELRAARLARFG